ncbi:MAG: histidine kinase [Lewinellaceae bacterium]|nr:histidine kinase [Phaeodactylibacter sp.]MCB9348574.1 histidine kinase [Lewinellaceae bacterium]
MRRHQQAMWGVFFVLLPFAGYCQPSFNNPIVLNEDNGLPSNYVSSAVPDEQGFIWLGTANGLVRFDGSEVKIFQKTEGDSASLADNMVNNLLFDSEGQLWIGTDAGVSVMDTKQGSFRNFDGLTVDGLPAGRINVLFEDSHGYLWMGSGPGGLCRYSHCIDQFETFRLHGGEGANEVDVVRINTVLDIQPGLEGDSVLWLATLGGLVRFNTEAQQQRAYAFSSPEAEWQHGFNSMRKVCVHPNGKIYIGGWGGAGVFDPATKQFQHLDFPGTDGHRSIARRAVLSLLPVGPSELWITYNRGLVVLGLDELAPRQIYYNQREEEITYGVSRIDGQGRMWAPTEWGFFLFNPLRNQGELREFPVPDDELYYITNGVEESKDGRFLYLAVIQGEGLYILDRHTGQWSIVRAAPSFYDSQGGFPAQKIHRLKNGRILLVGTNEFFYFLEEERRLEHIPLPFPDKAPFFRSLVEGEEGVVWAGSRRRGLFRVNLAEGTVRHFERELQEAGDANRSTWIENLFRDSQGNIWIRTASGFSVFLSAEDEIINFPTAGADGSKQSQSFANVGGFAEDNHGRLWVAGGTEGLGVVNLDRPEKGIVRKYTSKEGLKCEQVQNVICDKSGMLWLNSGRGLVRFNPATLESELFGPGYGIPVKNANSFSLLASGELTIGTRKGIYFFHPDSLRANPEHPVPYLTSFKVFDEEKSLPTEREMRLSYRQNFFSFEFSAISYNLPEQNTFAYQLVGVDPDWVFAGKRRFASYTNIPGGRYQFRVKAANNEGVWNEQAYMLDIFITTPWWRSWWFWLSLGLFLLLDTVFFVRWRIAQVRKKEAMKADFDRRLANVELNALRAQMNPHFIFNCLNSIDYYILKNDTDKASDYLNRFSRLIRLILQNSRSEYINLKDELELLKLYIEMESLRFEQQFDYAVKIGRGLNLEDIEIPPMLLQPYVENAIWHGLVHKDGRGRLDLAITRQNGFLYCVIEDNGIGREEALRLRSKTATRRKSMGMAITKDRINMINRLYKVDTSVEVIDLKDDKGQARGTRVEVRIPL